MNPCELQEKLENAKQNHKYFSIDYKQAIPFNTFQLKGKRVKNIEIETDSEGISGFSFWNKNNYNHIDLTAYNWTEYSHYFNTDADLFTFTDEGKNTMVIVRFFND